MPIRPRGKRWRGATPASAAVHLVMDEARPVRWAGWSMPPMPIKRRR
jgi:hypothetical protein